MRFKNRLEAGELLAKKIPQLNAETSLVLALPRGGVPLALLIADKHSVPLDLIFAKKIGHPSHSEYAIGAVVEDGQAIMNEMVSIEESWLARRLEEIQAEIKRRRQEYSPFLEEKNLKDKDVLIVDDGIATGMTMFAAISKLKEANVSSISVAVPVIPYDTYQKLVELVDHVYYCLIPDQFIGSVSAYYQSFPQVSDQEVQDMLESINI